MVKSKIRIPTLKQCSKCKYQVPIHTKTCPKCSEPFDSLVDDQQRKIDDASNDSDLIKNFAMGLMGVFSVIIIISALAWGITTFLKKDTFAEQIARIEDKITTLDKSDFGERFIQYGRLLRLVPSSEEYNSLYAFYERKLLENMSSFAASHFLKGFGSFEYEAQKAASHLNCQNDPIIDTTSLNKSDFKCVLDRFETTSWIVESGKNDRTGSVNFLWNDYEKGIGEFPPHAGKPEAFKALKKLIMLYAPRNPDEIQSVFWGMQDHTLSAENFNIYYSFKKEGDIGLRHIKVENSIKGKE